MRSVEFRILSSNIGEIGLVTALFNSGLQPPGLRRLENREPESSTPSTKGKTPLLFLRTLHPDPPILRSPKLHSLHS